MIKIFKWIYDLGYKHGWDKAVEATRKGHNVITSEEGEQMRLQNELFAELSKDSPTQS